MFLNDIYNTDRIDKINKYLTIKNLNIDVNDNKVISQSFQILAAAVPQPATWRRIPVTSQQGWLTMAKPYMGQ